MKELTKEQMLKEMQEIKKEIQLKFITDLLDRVKHYEEKSLKKDYIVSLEEHQIFTKIYNIIKSIDKYL